MRVTLSEMFGLPGEALKIALAFAPPTRVISINFTNYFMIFERLVMNASPRCVGNGGVTAANQKVFSQ